MKLYNTLTRLTEDFIPNDGKKVNLYTCGPTVYHYAHIGNLRTYIMEDILEKSLNYVGYDVLRVMNITDVGHLTSDADTGEDKMLKGAKRENKTVLEIAAMYTEAFFKDTDALNIQKPEIIAPATQYIDEYITIIQGLLDKGFAYESAGNIYFDTSKLEEYYALTNQTKEDLKTAVRDDVEEDLGKKNQEDFVLWFTKSKFDNQELKWDSPFGVGYPGWHIECSGIAMRYFGEYVDIHCGGVDNIFPHHTNEIAQSESYLGHKWCNYWVHVEHLNDNTGKMSKSKGEFLTLSLLKEKGYNPLAYRMFCLQSHYRRQLVFSYEALENTQNAYNKLINKIKTLKEDNNFNQKDFDLYNNQFKDALKNDLNTSLAVTTLYDVLKADISDATKLKLIENFDLVLSLDLLKENVIDDTLKQYIEQSIEKRNEAKKNKDFTLADSIRNELEEKGIIIKDSREGTTYEVK